MLQRPHDHDPNDNDRFSSPAFNRCPPRMKRHYILLPWVRFEGASLFFYDLTEKPRSWRARFSPASHTSHFPCSSSSSSLRLGTKLRCRQSHDNQTTTRVPQSQDSNHTTIKRRRGYANHTTAITRESNDDEGTSISRQQSHNNQMTRRVHQIHDNQTTTRVHQSHDSNHTTIK